MKTIVIDRGYDKVKGWGGQWVEGMDTYAEPSTRVVFYEDEIHVQIRIKKKVTTTRIYLDSQELILAMRCLQKQLDKKIGRLTYV